MTCPAPLRRRAGIAIMSGVKRVEIDPGRAGPRPFAQAVKSIVVPRPIAWVSSVSAAGVENLAPHSFFTMASEAPAVAQFTSIGAKDSLRNVLETREFVISLASEPQFEQVNATGTDYPREISEFEALGIEREPSAVVRPPRVADSPAVMECRLLDTIEVGNGTIVLGEVLHLAIAQHVVLGTRGSKGDVGKGASDPGAAGGGDVRADINELRPLARLGGIQWAQIGEIREIHRIPYTDL